MFVETVHITALLQSAKSLYVNQFLGMNPQASSLHRFAVSGRKRRFSTYFLVSVREQGFNADFTSSTVARIQHRSFAVLGRNRFQHGFHGIREIALIQHNSCSEAARE